MLPETPILLTDAAKNACKRADEQLMVAIKRTLGFLSVDMLFGLHIPRHNILKQVVRRYGTDRLWKVDLVGFRRMIYTISGTPTKITVLDIIDHPTYDKIFGYKKK